jgi:glycosyltransferase involved in cell wall biosynthesis
VTESRSPTVHPLHVDPTVSIVTMFLNEERFLAEAIHSVIAQTFDGWELLLVNDGSSDGSLAIARRYAASHPGRIRYLEHPGGLTRGMSASRNLGMQHARGSYIAFLDADDTWLPEKLERQLEILRADPAVVMVYGQTYFWYGWTGASDDVARDFITRPRVATGVAFPAPELLKRCLADENQFPTGSSVLLRRAVVDRLGGYDEAFSLYEDLAFYCKVMLEERVYVSASWWHKYRRHPGSASARAVAAGANHEHKGRYLEWLSRYVTERRMGDPHLMRLVSRTLCPYRYPRLYALRVAAARPLRKLSRMVLPRPVLVRLKGRDPAPVPQRPEI